MSIEFTDDEIETIKDLINDWGSDCPGTEHGKVLELQYKLGMAVRPTPEEIAEEERKREAFCNTPFGKKMAELFNYANTEMAALDIMYGSKSLWDDTQHLKIGSKLKIVMPINRIGNKNE